MMDHEDYMKLIEELITQSAETMLILVGLDECVDNDDKPVDEIDAVLKFFKQLLRPTNRV